MQTGDYMTKGEAADFLRVSPWTIAKWLTEKKLTRYKAGGRTLVARVDLEKFVVSGEGK